MADTIAWQAPSGALGPGVVLMGAWTLGEIAVEALTKPTKVADKA